MTTPTAVVTASSITIMHQCLYSTIIIYNLITSSATYSIPFLLSNVRKPSCDTYKSVIGAAVGASVGTKDQVGHKKQQITSSFDNQLNCYSSKY